jgi:cell division protein FtsL
MGAQGTIRLALAFALLLGSLTLVVWRQGRALEDLRALDHTRSARALAESERAGLLGRIEHLESRARIVGVATERLGMRIPLAGDEIVILLRGSVPDSAVGMMPPPVMADSRGAR